MSEPSYSLEDFLARYRVGKAFEHYVATLLRNYCWEGMERPLWVEVSDDEVTMERDDEVRRAYGEEDDDLVVEGTYVVSVKSRTMTFTGPHDYPFKTAWLDTLDGWKMKKVKPRFVVLICQETRGIAVASFHGYAEKRYLAEMGSDPKRGLYNLPMVAIGREHLVTFERMAEWLSQHQGGHDGI
jgi:hypothetical protein